MADVKVSIGADSKQLEAGLKEAQAKVKDFKDKLSGAKGGEGKGGKSETPSGIMGMVKRFMALAVIKQMVDLVKDITDAAWTAAIDRTAQSRRNMRALAGSDAQGALGQSGSVQTQIESKRDELQKSQAMFTGVNALLSPIEAIRQARMRRELEKDILVLKQEQNRAGWIAIRQGESDAKIATLRLEGRTREADAMQREEDLLNRVEKFTAENPTMDPAKRSKIIEQMKERAELERALRGKAHEDSQKTTSVASSAQALGLGGGVALFGRNPDEDSLRKTAEHLRAIRQKIESMPNFTPAKTAPLSAPHPTSDGTPIPRMMPLGY